jgi:hypothetical protein
MSFIPAVPDFCNSALLTPAGTLSVQVGTMTNNLAQKGTETMNPIHSPATPKLVRRQLPRARKARVRLRQQNKLRFVQSSSFSLYGDLKAELKTSGCGED